MQGQQCHSSLPVCEPAAGWLVDFNASEGHSGTFVVLTKIPALCCAGQYFADLLAPQGALVGTHVVFNAVIV